VIYLFADYHAESYEVSFDAALIRGEIYEWAVDARAINETLDSPVFSPENNPFFAFSCRVSRGA
jgi:hypothetical protein